MPSARSRSNEIRPDQPSTDLDEYVELTGPAATSLDGVFFIAIGDGSGGSGTIENVTDLTGFSLDSNEFFVIAESTFSLGTADLVTTIGMGNSDNITHLLVEDFTGANGDDLDTDDDGTLDATPWTSIIDEVAFVESVGTGDLIYNTTTVGPDGTSMPGHAARWPVLHHHRRLRRRRCLRRPCVHRMATSGPPR